MTQRTTPPFRADHVGSLLRTAPLKDSRAKRERGEISAGALKEIEDREIERVIKKQEDVGLQSITDGEFRRSWWHFDFFWHLTGCERVVLDHGIQFHGIQTKPESLKVTAKLDFPADHPMLEHFKFVAANTKLAPKMTIPSPSSLHFRYGRDAVPESIYPDMADFYHDLGQTYRLAVRAFADAGEGIDVVTYMSIGRDRGRFVHRSADGEVHVITAPNAYAGVPVDVRSVLLKVHGEVDLEPARDGESFVVSEDDYITYLAETGISGVLPVTLAARLRRSHFLFLGYGLVDWSFRVFLHRLWPDEQPAYRSWAVQPDPGSLEREFWRRRAIELVDLPLEQEVDRLRIRAQAEQVPVVAS